jgi:hypothetical protein
MQEKRHLGTRDRGVSMPFMREIWNMHGKIDLESLHLHGSFLQSKTPKSNPMKYGSHDCKVIATSECVFGYNFLPQPNINILEPHEREGGF